MLSFEIQGLTMLPIKNALATKQTCLLMHWMSYLTYSKEYSLFHKVRELFLKTFRVTLVAHCMCVCSNANPLHYYMLRVPRRADTWR